MADHEIKALKELIGTHHLSKLSKFFYQRMIFNRDGEPYSQIFLSRVFNGHVSNPTIEAGIWEFAEQVKKEKEKTEKRKAEILAPTKPVKQ